jgi:hypothetical protein
MIAMKMKTNKQQLVILMSLVIPATITIVTTTTTQQAFAKHGSSRDQVCTTDTQRQEDPAYCITNDLGNALKHGIMGLGDALTSPADTPPR